MMEWMECVREANDREHKERRRWLPMHALRWWTTFVLFRCCSYIRLMMMRLRLIISCSMFSYLAHLLHNLFTNFTPHLWRCCKIYERLIRLRWLNSSRGENVDWVWRLQNIWKIEFSNLQFLDFLSLRFGCWFRDFAAFLWFEVWNERGGVFEWSWIQLKSEYRINSSVYRILNN